MAEQMEDNISAAGIWVPCYSKTTTKVENIPLFVHEKNSAPYYNLQQLAIAVSCNRPVLLQGPVGSGKTSTVEYLAYLTGHGNPNEQSQGKPLFLKVQLGEQTDARLLLGGYQCTEIPGKFIWKPGVLTQAVLKGFWLLLEDIDCTSSDVISLVDNLVKTQSLSVPGYSDNIIPHSQFQLFATQRTTKSEYHSRVQNNISKHWITIRLNPLSNSEINQIVIQKYSKLASISSRMISVLDLDLASNQSNARIPSVRDILKWCNRCNFYFKDGSVESALRIFQDAVDIFCGFMDKELRSKTAVQIGIKLGIVKNKANFLSSAYKPNVMMTDEKFMVGRSYLERRSDSIAVMKRTKKNVFSLNTHSCCLIEKICSCLEFNEPVLLVGETGCGKTTILQYLANTLGRTLVVINMNQQSDTADLIGGFKPVSFKWIMKPLCDKFETLFRNLFDTDKNADCLIKFSRLVKKQNWDVLINFIIHVQQKALAHINKQLKNRREGDIFQWNQIFKSWEDLGTMVDKYSKQKQAAERSLVFSFIEGSLITAMKNGQWVLLDEINLANSETLDCLSGLLENTQGSISLLEKGENKPVHRDPGFRLFAAMNPVTDVGKKQLTTGLRNRFTELFIDEIDDPHDLLPLVDTYLCELNVTPVKLNKIVNFYLTIKKESKTLILDGNGKKPHYSLRNLCRALMITAKNACGSVPRSLYEGLSISFLTNLDCNSYKLVNNAIIKAVTDSDIRTLLNQPIPKPKGNNFINIQGFWLSIGTLVPSTPDNYILTPTVERHFQDLIKIVSLGSGIPILLEGDTSVGKTSLINYLARRTGNVCSRVNNHEHTDIQEYIGTYVADSQGKLIFKEGILCESMRKGYWLILDELNLAPTEVLEALNRVLDDNRELFIPETQTTIKAHEKFLLFATQNPPGLYGGRKELSRAFRNRFIELHFSPIPANELITILEKRCQVPLSYCKKMVYTMTDLQLRRRGSDIFVGKSGFITLRDLFRWGERYQKAKVDAKFYDWDQHIADEGYILLAGRVRLQQECKVIEDVLTKYFKRKTNPDNLFSLHNNTSEVTKSILQKLINYSNNDKNFEHIVWTYNMRKLGVQVWKALDFSEPILLVGETGCGKTSIVQLLAKIREQDLYSINCHMHSESADFLGGLRPIRDKCRSSGKFFEWCDGPLVQAMITGSFFLADEISLADDSVLERLNSLLEPERTILLAEKGGGLIENENEDLVTVANEKFQFIGTMNPGGDYGKKELSPALRNRFTEIWAEAAFNKFECNLEIIKHNLKLPNSLKLEVSELMARFLNWFQNTDLGKKVTISIRDVLTWVNFINLSDLKWFESCIHGVFLTFLDGLGSGNSLFDNFIHIKKFKHQCINFLIKEIIKISPEEMNEKFLKSFFENSGVFTLTEDIIGIHPFYIKKGKWCCEQDNYVFNSPTTFVNAKRLLRGLKINKAIMLEGSPGVGKTSLVSSLAKVSGHKLTRINLSDQTDISDLFGADLPEEGESVGRFAWRDGPFLTALKEGQWILLDELNLASQSVLEGLNAVLDHRGSIYIPELNKTFYISTETKLFGCQNPLKEGGNRRGLPRSFLNRFTRVYVEPLTEHDYNFILKETFSVLSKKQFKEDFVINQMIKFNAKICQEIMKGQIGLIGGPWEFNLRDMIRWAEGLILDCNSTSKPMTEDSLLKVIFKYMNLLYMNRFRTKNDREKVYEIFNLFFGSNDFINQAPQIYVAKNFVVMGENSTKVNNSFFYGDLNEFEMFADADNCIIRENEGKMNEILKLCSSYRGRKKLEDLRLLEKQYPVLCSLCYCSNMSWLSILVGETGTGKTNCVRTLAALKGENLKIMSCNPSMDTSEILGGFEQVDYNRHLDSISESSRIVILSAARRYLEKGTAETTINLLKSWIEYKELPLNDDSSSAALVFDAFLNKVKFLQKLLTSKKLRIFADLNKMCDDILKELIQLKENLSMSDCLTFGGKFEWVNSILVKALKDGSWLLVEDVNLCSNAVLDRLNCLLEPNGTLIISERGAGADGQLVTIKPHPNFRLFFTMDPRKGTISRAMRNRGVEIYFLDDEKLTSWPKLDLISLLSDLGIEDTATQKALIQLESQSENPNISSLISNGFWTAQYVNHGFQKSEAFRLSSKHIYTFFDCSKESLIDELSSTISGNLFVDITFARPPLNTFLINPSYGRLKQSLSFIYLLKGFDQQTLEMLQHYFPFNKFLENFKFDEILKYNILHIFLTSSCNCNKILKKYLCDFIKDWGKDESKGKLKGIIERLSSILPEIDSDFLWDGRWFENASGFFNHFPDSEANKFLVLMKYLWEPFPENDCVNSEEITVARYSESVQEGLFENSFPEEPIVSRLIKFLNDFDQFTVETLKSSSVKITEEEAKWLLNVMKWRFRLGNQGKLILFSGKNKKKLNEDTLTLLELHLSWFLKFVLDDGKQALIVLKKTLPESLKLQHSEFFKSSNDIVSSRNSSKLMKICSIFRKNFGYPSPNQLVSDEKIIENEIASMDITDSNAAMQGDLFILRKVLFDFIQCVGLELHSCVGEQFDRQKFPNLSEFSMLLNKLDKNVKYVSCLMKLVEDYDALTIKEKHKRTSELIFFFLKILNCDYEFAEEVNEDSERIYQNQVLPFHRPVQTCRILNLVFPSKGLWNLSNFRKSQDQLTSLLLTLLPNINEPVNQISRKPMIDHSLNERYRVNLELNRVLKSLKKSLRVESEDKGIKEILKEMAEKSTLAVEKIFYTRIDMIVTALLRLKLNSESGFVIFGCCWSLLGLLDLLILREGKIDPIRRKLIKADYAKTEVAELESEILAFELYSTITGINQKHFYIKNLKEQLQKSMGNVSKYNHLYKVKRNPAAFRELCKEIESFMTGFNEIFRFCEDTLENLNGAENQSKDLKEKGDKVAQFLYRKGRFLNLKNKKFSQILEDNFLTHFGDLVYPILAASVQIEHGINLIMSELLRRPYTPNNEIGYWVSEFCRFPFNSKSQPFSKFQELNSNAWPREALKKIENNKLLILFSSCTIKFNEWLFFKNDFYYNELMTVFARVVEFWKKEENKRIEEEMKNESLYLKRSTEKCKTMPEEEEFLEEQLKLFPTFEEDFSDGTFNKEEKVEANLGSLTNEHLCQISKLHMKIVKEFVKTEWYPCKNSNLTPDLLVPIRMRFVLLSQILPNISYLLNNELDHHLLPGLLVLINCRQSGLCTTEASLEFSEDNLTYNFYQDKNVEEVSKCLEILQELRARLEGLLNEWPDHSALIQIKTLIERILSFSVDSPIMRFLTGLELLLQSCQHWESVAHSGVSIAEHLIKITNIIIEWRKLELKGWKNCLEAAHNRLKNNAFKWWFHFWCLVEEYLTKEHNNSIESLGELLKALNNFLETSPIGEFETRLNILLSFHFHLLHIPASTKRDSLCIALWNLYAFYQQFNEAITKKLVEDSSTVVKKLKEFVGIAKWHDITYWSVKQAIDKSHRTLLKYIKEYEVILQQKVNLKTLDPTRKNVTTKIKEPTRIDISQYLKTSVPEKDNKIIDKIPQKYLGFKNLGKKLEKARKYSNDIILRAEYPNLILNLEGLTENICQSTKHFAELDVDRNLPKEKQKSQAKNIVHQKRRALSDLFKILQKIGLSYRAGLNENVFGILELCNSPPMDFSENERPPGAKGSGEAYYLKTVFRKQVLENSLLTPSKELLPQVIERLRGFSNHFVKLNQKQKNTLAEFSFAFKQFQQLESTLISLTESKDSIILNQHNFFAKIQTFKETISECCYILQQFSLILDSWPLVGGSKMKEMNFSTGNLTPLIFLSSKNDEIYIDIRRKFEEICARFLNLKQNFETTLIEETCFNVNISKEACEIQQTGFVFYMSKHLIKYELCVQDFKHLIQDLEEFLKAFDADTVSNQIANCLYEVKQMSAHCHNYKPLENFSKLQSNELEELLNEHVKMLIEKVLLAIQSLAKKYLDDNENGEKFVEEDDSEEKYDNFEELLPDHFEKKLMKNLHLDLQDLNINQVNEIFYSIFRHLSTFTETSDLTSSAIKYLRILSTVLPFIKQYSILCSYFVEQQKLCFRTSNKLSSILFGTFIAVAQKGFCIPPEYEDEGEGDGQSWNENEGGGFTGGEGEGQKDVSERIETEDQLEDARPEVSEKDEKQEKDCKEEEKGIEMTENFDGKTQNLDNEDEEVEGDNEEDEPDDKEMGETEPGADKLESEMWSDSENEEEEKEDKKEDKGKGEEINRDKYAAKNDEDNVDDERGSDTNENKKKQKQKEINEMDEPEENEDQFDPYHGHHEPELEPEAMDLPDNLQLDDAEMKGDEDVPEENPFDIDAMKEHQPPEELNKEDKIDEEDKKEDEKKNEEDSDGENLNPKEETTPEEMEIDEDKEDCENDLRNKNEVEDKTNEDPKEEEWKNEDEFYPSDDKPSELAAQPAPNSKSNEQFSADKVVGAEENHNNDSQPQEISQNSEKESEGVGQAEMEKTKQSHDAKTSKKEKLKSGQSQMQKERKRERPGKSDEDRCLADAESQVNKRLKTLDKFEENEEKQGEQNEDSDLYQHVSEKLEEATQVLDAATKDQAENQPVPKKEEEKEAEFIPDEDLAMDVDDEDLQIEDVEKQKSSVVENNKSSNNVENEGEKLGEEIKKQIEGEVIKTMNVERGPETTFHTQLTNLENEKSTFLTSEEIQALRFQIQDQLSKFNGSQPTEAKSMHAWQLLTSVVEGLARDLSEQLRLILEPTRATRLKGDYRTGKRINMRKVISYIASEFRKDNIWLRRTKPWKRDHEIVLAIDDSSSMAHNESKELAFESLALVFKALGLIEAGHLGVLSFGEKTKIVHRPGDPFADEIGARILQEFTFEQDKTLVSEMLEISTSLMMSSQKNENVARLLVIISDGRGVFSEGIDRVKTAVRGAMDSGIFVVFVIIDNPKSKDSIMDIRVPEFKDGKFLGIKSYMELFPFPYYLILRDISALPNTLGDALRQWFQLISSNCNK